VVRSEQDVWGYGLSSASIIGKLFFSDKFPSERLFESARQSADPVDLVTLA
jgi:hypothetical protein